MSIESKKKEQEKRSDKIEKNMERSTKKNYTVGLAKIKADIRKFWEKYSEDGVITLEEATKLNRLQKMEQQIRENVNEIYKGNTKDYNKGLSNVYEDNYYSTGYLLETEAQAKLNFKLLDREQVKASVQNPISGLTLNETLNKNRKEIITKTKQQLTQAIVRGEGLKKVARRMSKLYEGDYNKSIRIVRTETTRNRNAGTLAGYNRARDMGLEFDTVWLSASDDRTRESHGMLNGQKADKNGYFTSGAGNQAVGPGQFGVAEEDINCRCTTIVKLKEEPVKKNVVPQDNYSDWKNERLQSRPTQKPSKRYDNIDQAYKTRDLTGISQKNQEEIKNRLLELSNEYTVVDTKNLNISTLSEKGMLGYSKRSFPIVNGVVNEKAEISFSKQYFKNDAEARRIFKVSKDNNISRATSIKNIIDHEYAHEIDKASIFKLNPGLKERRDSLFNGKPIANEKEKERFKNYVSDAYINSRKMSDEVAEGIKKNLNLNEENFKDKIKTNYGKYALTNNEEFFAEGFMNMRMGSTDEITKAFTDEFNKKYKEIF